MNKKQAGEVIQYVIDLFNLDMTDKQIKTWAILLIERGDYEETMKNVKRRASNGSRFKPTISEIIITNRNTGNEVVKNVDKTQTHAYKKKHSKKYAKAMSEMEKLRDKIKSEVKDDE